MKKKVSWFLNIFCLNKKKKKSTHKKSVKQQEKAVCRTKETFELFIKSFVQRVLLFFWWCCWCSLPWFDSTLTFLQMYQKWRLERNTFRIIETIRKNSFFRKIQRRLLFLLLRLLLFHITLCWINRKIN